jgi:hypothetical protein
MRIEDSGKAAARTDCPGLHPLRVVKEFSQLNTLLKHPPPRPSSAARWFTNIGADNSKSPPRVDARVGAAADCDAARGGT